MTYETLLIGIVVAVVFTEMTALYPGGIIVPGYVALQLDRPLGVLITLLLAFASLGTYRLLSRHVILFGKRRFVTLVLLGALGSQAASVIGSTVDSGYDLLLVGWLIPGLLANNLEKQPVVPTLASMLSVSVVTYSLVRLITWFG